MINGDKEIITEADLRSKIENISDRDAEKLTRILKCINELWEEARRKREIISKDRFEQIFDNFALDRFVSELALLLDDIESRRHIRDYIAANNARFMIEVPLEES